MPSCPPKQSLWTSLGHMHQIAPQLSIEGRNSDQDASRRRSYDYVGQQVRGVTWSCACPGVDACPNVLSALTVGVNGRGTVWYRLVGVDLASQGNLTADVEASIRIFTGQAAVQLAFGAYQQVVAPNASATPGAT